jgi:hypothetical protein
MKKALIIFLMLSALSACKDGTINKETKKDEIAKSAVVKPAHIATEKEWQDALLLAYTESNVKDNGDGTSDFTACFYKKDNKCQVFSFGKRDGFRKLRFFHTIYSELHSIGLVNYVKTYLSLTNGKKPFLIINPVYFDKKNWLFMENLSVMVESEVVLEKGFIKSIIDRNVERYGVEESYSFIAEEKEINALRKITQESNVIVRITGSKGYVNLEKSNVIQFKKDIITALYMYDKLNKTLEGHTLP